VIRNPCGEDRGGRYLAGNDVDRGTGRMLLL
jgi:hypothetical protein